MVGLDGVNESETTVVIRVRDTNDLPPVFNIPLYETTIYEETVHTQVSILKVSPPNHRYSTKAR